MSKSMWTAVMTVVMVHAGDIAFAMQKPEADPAHHGPGWLSGLASLSGFILAWASVVLIYMMVSGKAGKYKA
ncbi:MAG: hypothetical protein OEW11_04845 [Nitrospirota bacterium]|nr:hypothetical protein [Nitrospirota bacterium]